MSNTLSAQSASASQNTLTRRLLTGGLLAGPLYIVVSVIEMLLRPTFDIRRHTLSLLSNGDLGWIHITLFLLTGALVLAGAIGLKRARSGTWGPALLGLYGLALMGAGIFKADPALGFPPGTPPDAHDVSTSGLLHLVFGAVGFLGLIAGSLILARRFAGQGERGWAIFSALTGILFFAAFFGIVSGSQQGPATVTVVNLAFTAAVMLSWVWLSAVSAKQRRALSA